MLDGMLAQLSLNCTGILGLAFTDVHQQRASRLQSACLDVNMSVLQEKRLSYGLEADLLNSPIKEV
jgi:hypothetical protein